MTTVSQLAQKVRVALAVSAEYEGSTLPDAVRGVMRRLLRDYNFPKSVIRVTSADAEAVGKTQYVMPAGLKRPLEVRFFDQANNAWSRRLERREGFSLPYGSDGFGPAAEDLYGRFYWLEGNKLVVDTPMPAAGLRLTLWYQSMLVDAAAEQWMLDDMEDLIFSRAVMEAGLMLRKTEAANAYASLVAEQTKSIAMFANELEWNGVELSMREPRALPSDRYPTGPVVG